MEDAAEPYVALFEFHLSWHPRSSTSRIQAWFGLDRSSQLLQSKTGRARGSGTEAVCIGH